MKENNNEYKLMTDKYPYYLFKKAKTDKPKGNIFFIHGYAVNPGYHNVFADKLDDYNYYAVELPGHGVSPLNNKKQLRPFSYAVEVSNLIKELNLNNIILMGHSMGGGIAMMVANMIPELIKKIILVTPMNSKGTTNILGFLFKFNPKNQKQLDKLYDLLTYDYKNNKHLIPESDREELLTLHTKYRKDMLRLKHKMCSPRNLLTLSKAEKNIFVPTLLLLGKHDGCINYKTTTKNFNHKFKNKNNISIYLFQKAGHLPFSETPNEYYNVVMNFIQ